ncbi:hypothetical protein [Lysinibacillus sp. RC79]|uniref:hypothetical protein n=1 Tax=Lysinibacillus sp. RC79 TaxID=3156296 RepID=UPI003512B720
MSKFTSDEKIRIVSRYINGQESIHHIDREEGVYKPELRIWMLYMNNMALDVGRFVLCYFTC